MVGVDGWLDEVNRVESPNFDTRPPGSSIELIVVHNISLPPGCYGRGHVAQLFTNTLDPSIDEYFAQIVGVRVSAHVLIDRDGEATQFVSLNHRAWHAGVSAWCSRAACNDFSVGIELEGTDFESFTDLQYRSLNAVIAALLAAYPIRAVVGHSDIAPNRKTDPGPYFDWRRVQVPSSVSVPAA
ncbi:MAG: 1,6-anhydro-N-acetylmuramyl-L-alanine amidase AmpD [Burkholderiaceae bacterium]